MLIKTISSTCSDLTSESFKLAKTQNLLTTFYETPVLSTIKETNQVREQNIFTLRNQKRHLSSLAILLQTIYGVSRSHMSYYETKILENIIIYCLFNT